MRETDNTALICLRKTIAQKTNRESDLNFVLECQCRIRNTTMGKMLYKHNINENLVVLFTSWIQI